MLFSRQSALALARGLLGLRRSPLYVQYYITSRCNLTCKQCNIIYANADVREATTSETELIAENLKRIGVAIVLLTGGEPFVRRDLPEIIKAFESRGIHVRTQTNGYARPEAIRRAVDAGVRDVSISLDSLSPEKQEFLNGSYHRSWHRMLETVANITAELPRRNSFAAFGTVLSPHNLLEIPNIIRFATRIGWYVSLVPAHIADPAEMYGFRSYDREMSFRPHQHSTLDAVLAECVRLKRQGLALYDSEEYIANIAQFIKGGGITWRRRNRGLCDSPFLYFAIRPNGELAVCCDHNLRQSFPVWHPDFPTWFRDGSIASACAPHVRSCSGCMYGSYPEISITAHYPRALLDRARVFLRTPLPKPWPLSADQLAEIAAEIMARHPVDHTPGAELLENVAAHADVTHLPVIGSAPAASGKRP